jgi:hypothetical protein
MYLAVILGFCALTNPSVTAVVLRAQLPQLNQETQPAPQTAPEGSTQEPAPATPAAGPAQSSPESQSQPETKTPTAATPESQTTQPEPTAKKPESKAPASKKAATKKRHHHHRKGLPGDSSTSTEKKVIKNGGTADPVVQLAPGISAEQASSQRQSTAELLSATDDNLKQLASRQLDSTQQASVSQIRKYMEQAKTAEAAGDVQRAHNLASKALLLADDLVKH